MPYALALREDVMVKVMFLCTANSCRSQMAEGFAKTLGKEVIEPYSAGILPSKGVQPHAITVMQEVGIDITRQKPKLLNEKLLRKMDYVITLCGNAEQVCPEPSPAAKHLHWPVEDPVGTTGPEESVLDAFRRARDEIKRYMLRLLRDIYN